MNDIDRYDEDRRWQYEQDRAYERQVRYWEQTPEEEQVKDSDLHFGNDLPQPDRQIIDRAISKAAETPIGEVIDFEKCFYSEEN